MRIYVYKVLILVIAIFFLYQFTIGHSIYKLENKFYSSLDKKSVEDIKEKLRFEIKKSLLKERILSKEDAILLNKLLKKINSEIINSDKNFN
tara:strand:- start:835 stop:1110 length:276 start_codon:yes stop_codon:yes gene_type:complete